MRVDLKHCGVLLAWSLMLTALAGAADRSPLPDLVAARRCDNFSPLDARQLRLAEAGFAELLGSGGVLPDNAVAFWGELGFTLSLVDVEGEQWLVLGEMAQQCRGQGMYLIRRGRAAEVLLQVPHGYFDRHTDDIASGLLQAPLRAYAFNTVPRHFSREDDRVDADLAHRADTAFSALSRAFARTSAAGRLVQLHGFNAAKRETAAGRSAAAIVSAGSNWPSMASSAVASCLQSLLDEPVRLYPQEVGELGGTSNIQGQLLRALGHNGFVHVELNLALRERLRHEKQLRTSFAACLCGGMEER